MEFGAIKCAELPNWLECFFSDLVSDLVKSRKQLGNCVKQYILHKKEGKHKMTLKGGCCIDDRMYPILYTFHYRYKPYSFPYYFT